MSKTVLFERTLTDIGVELIDKKDPGEFGEVSGAAGDIEGRDQRVVINALLDGRHKSAAERQEWTNVFLCGNFGPMLRSALIQAYVETVDLNPTATISLMTFAFSQEFEVRLAVAENFWKLAYYSNMDGYNELRAAIQNDPDESVREAL